MYRRRLPAYQRNPARVITRLLLFGVLFGVGFVVVDSLRNRPPDGESVAMQPTAVEPTTTPLPTIAPIPTATPPPKASLFIPTAGVSARVVDVYLGAASWDVSALGANVGHLEGTAWMGAPGNIALAGHAELADGRPGVFSGIEQLNIGDPIILTLGTVEQHYRVVEIKRVTPDDLTVLYPSATDKITLITCDSYDFLSNIYQDRIVVVAERDLGASV
jgi:LPXTG-site transpeptidase (sortase) family protein